jgi:hypothetical protein
MEGRYQVMNFIKNIMQWHILYIQFAFLILQIHQMIAIKKAVTTSSLFMVADQIISGHGFR